MLRDAVQRYRDAADVLRQAQRGPDYEPSDGYNSGNALCAALIWFCLGMLSAWLIVSAL